MAGVFLKVNLALDTKYKRLCRSLNSFRYIRSTEASRHEDGPRVRLAQAEARAQRLEAVATEDELDAHEQDALEGRGRPEAQAEREAHGGRGRAAAAEGRRLLVGEPHGVPRAGVAACSGVVEGARVDGRVVGVARARARRVEL